MFIFTKRKVNFTAEKIHAKAHQSPKASIMLSAYSGEPANFWLSAITVDTYVFRPDEILSKQPLSKGLLKFIDPVDHIF